ncbi:hypothetical protein V8E53_008350 [Lactarius tabidus]
MKLKDVRRQSDYGMKTRTPGRRGNASGATGSNIPVEEADRKDQPGLSARSQTQGLEDGPSSTGNNDQLANSRSSETPQTQSILPEMPRFIGDFDDSANALWSLHLKEAKSHDEARIQSLRDDMDSVLIFAGLFSAALTSFTSDKIHDLQVDPAQQMVYYQQQIVVLLAQLSKQVASITPQVSIPSTPPPLYPKFSPNPSDVRVNAYWFMSLVFSLFAALLATLVQQWVREYMHVFQRYSNPLKSARLRQYLYDGAEGWYMPIVAESVPGLVHVSLFLFFLGLGDSLLAVNTTVGVTTIIPITICGLLYVLSMFAPIVNPQSPFRNPFSGLIWYAIRKVHPKTYSDRTSSGALKTVSLKMSEGQAQLAMEENEDRKDRDVQAVQWLIDNRTEDDEMESFVMAIPGTFTSKWGVEVWRKVSEEKQHEDASPSPNVPAVSLDEDLHQSVQHSALPRRICHPRSLLYPLGRILGIRTTNGPHDLTATPSRPHLPSSDRAPDDPHSNGEIAISDLCRRVRHLLDTCDNRSLFAKEELWHKRARGCVETVASLAFCAGITLEPFGDLGRLLRELGELERIRELSAAGSDVSFVTRWTCLSLVATRGISNHDGRITSHARLAINNLSWIRMEDDGEQANFADDDEIALRNARRIDNYLKTAMQFCVGKLRGALRSAEVGDAEVQIGEVLAREHETDISNLESIASTVGRMEDVDRVIFRVNDWIRSVSPGLIAHLPGVSFDEFRGTELIHPIQFFNLSVTEGQAFTPQFVFLRQRLRLLCSYTQNLRDIIDGQGNGVYQEVLESLRILWDDADRGQSIIHQGHLMERQLWRLQDIRDGGGFGFSVELFFLALAQLLSMASSQDSHAALYIGTFRAMTSDWRRYKHSIGTQRVILNLVCDVARPHRGIISDRRYPRYVTDELLVLLGNIVEGQSGSHIDDAMMELDALPLWFAEGRLFRAEAIEIISRSQARVPSP